MTGDRVERRRWSTAGALAAVVVLLASCSSGSTEARELMDLETAANEAHAALVAASTGATTENAAAAWDTAATALDDLEKVAADATGPNSDMEREARYYIRSGGYMLNLLRQGEVEQAQAVQRLELVPAYATFRGDLDVRLRELEAQGADTDGGAVSLPLREILAGVIVVSLVVVVARFLTARRRGTEEPSRAADVLPGAPKATGESPAPRPANQTDRPNLPQGADFPPEAAAAARGAVRRSSLAEIVEAALAQAEKTGWHVELDVPDFSILVEPFRLRRVIGNLLLSASGSGAEHIGIVAEEEDDFIAISIGDDGAIARAAAVTADGFPSEVDHQIAVARQLLAGSDARIDWMRLEGVSLYMLELQRADRVEIAEEPQAPAPAETP